jgi:hypothetical protein
LTEVRAIEMDFLRADAAAGILPDVKPKLFSPVRLSNSHGLLTPNKAP